MIYIYSVFVPDLDLVLYGRYLLWATYFETGQQSGHKAVFRQQSTHQNQPLIMIVMQKTQKVKNHDRGMMQEISCYTAFASR